MISYLLSGLLVSVISTTNPTPAITMIDEVVNPHRIVTISCVNPKIKIYYNSKGR
jgi:hypothetical protein